MGTGLKAITKIVDSASQRSAQVRLVNGHQKRVPQRYLWCGTSYLGRTSIRTSERSGEIKAIRDAGDLQRERGT